LKERKKKLCVYIFCGFSLVRVVVIIIIVCLLSICLFGVFFTIFTHHITPLSFSSPYSEHPHLYTYIYYLFLRMMSDVRTMLLYLSSHITCLKNVDLDETECSSFLYACVCTVRSLFFFLLLSCLLCLVLSSI